jgi:hypothetical protein
VKNSQHGGIAGSGIEPWTLGKAVSAQRSAPAEERGRLMMVRPRGWGLIACKQKKGKQTHGALSFMDQLDRPKRRETNPSSSSVLLSETYSNFGLDFQEIWIERLPDKDCDKR